jgi:hypothetical protein
MNKNALLSTLFTLSFSLLAEGPKLSPASTVAFAGIDEARTILTNRDDFIAALSRFDRAARMKTDQEVTEADFLAFLGRNALSWSVVESNKVMRVCQNVSDKLVGWNLPLPATVLLIKTSGAEEGQAVYTRQNAIILPQHKIRSSELDLENSILHELFHIMSRHNSDLRKSLYRVIGFTPVNSIEYPMELSERKITNPDGFETEWFITLTNGNQTLPTIPILYADQERYDPKRGGEFFAYLVFKLMVITNENGNWQPRLVDGRPQFLDPQEVQGFFDQIGKNTGYIIHPDEILAENFVKLLSGETNLPSPRVIEGMRSILGHAEPSLPPRGAEQRNQ